MQLKPIQSTNYKPRYYNTQTETVIIAVSQSTSLYRILNLQITKKNATEPIIIDTKTIPICSITAIKANEDESLFICEYDDSSIPKKSFVINLNNPDSPLITGYHHCVFKTDDSNTMYVASDHAFGVFDITTNTFNPIKSFPDDSIQDMQLNNNQSWIVLRGHNIIYIGKKTNDGSFDFDEIDIQFFKKNCSVNCDYIRAVCFHPNQNKLCVLLEHYKNNDPICCMIDLKSYKTALLSLSNEIKDVYSNNISFLSDKILYLDSSHHHYFINTTTGNHWTKKKNGSQILFTTDKNHSLEEDSTYSNGREYHELKMVPLCNKTMSEGIALLNKGEFPLLLLNITHNKPHTIVTLDDDDDYKQYLQLKNSAVGPIIDNVYTITQKDRCAYFYNMLRHYCPAKKTIKGWTAAIAFMMIGWGLYRALEYFDNSKRLDSSDKRNLAEGIFRLVCYLIRV